MRAATWTIALIIGAMVSNCSIGGPLTQNNTTSDAILAQGYFKAQSTPGFVDADNANFFGFVSVGTDGNGTWNLNPDPTIFQGIVFSDLKIFVQAYGEPGGQAPTVGFSFTGTPTGGGPPGWWGMTTRDSTGTAIAVDFAIEVRLMPKQH